MADWTMKSVAEAGPPRLAQARASAHDATVSSFANRTDVVTYRPALRRASRPAFAGEIALGVLAMGVIVTVAWIGLLGYGAVYLVRFIASQL